MGASWQTPDQRVFILEHTPSYVQHVANKTKAVFWADFLEKWFEAWPLKAPEPELIEKAGSLKGALVLCRAIKVNVSTIYLPTNQLELTVHTATEACLQSE